MCASSSPSQDISPERSIDISYRRIFRITWPVVVSQLSMTLMGLVDTIMVGRLGVTTLAAVGLANFLVWWLLSFFWGLVSAVNTLVAQKVGADDQRAVGVTFWQGLYLGLASAVALVAIVPLVPWLISWTGAAPEMRGIAVEYMSWRLLGAGAFGLYFAVDNYYRGLGETRVPMVCGVVQAVLNCAFNYLLIFGHAGFPALGAVGAAIGTAAAQLVVGLVLFGTIFLRADSVRYRIRQTWRLDPATVRALLVLGWPIGIQFFMEMGGVTVFTTLVARLGEAPMAATNAVVQIWAQALMVTLAVSVAATTLVGQAVGARRFDQARRAVTRVQWLGALPLVLLGGLFLAVPEQLLHVFTDDASLAPYARPLLVVATLYLVFDLPFNALSGALRGAGDTRYPMYVSIGVSWLVFVPAVWWATGRFGVVGAWSCFLVLIVLQVLLVARRYRGEDWLCLSGDAADETAPPSPPSESAAASAAASPSSAA